MSEKLRHLHKNTRSCVENKCCCPRTVNFSNVNFTSKYLYHQNQYSKTRDSKCLALIAQMVRAFGTNPKVGVRVPLRSRHFLSQTLWYFHKNIRSCVENESCCPRTVNILNVNFTPKIFPTETHRNLKSREISFAHHLFLRHPTFWKLHRAQQWFCPLLALSKMSKRFDNYNE